MKVKVKHLKEMHFNGEGNSKVLVNIDSSVTAGGSGKGTSPMELVLMAVAGCSGMDIVTILEKMKVKYKRFEIEVTGERASEHPRVFTDIEVIFKFWGDNIPKDKVDRAISLSMEKYCSVANMLDKAANIIYSSEVNPDT